MVARSSRMQRTRTIAAAIKSIYYARVCYIRAIYSLPLSVSFSHSFVYSHPFIVIRSLSLFFFFTLSPYCKFLLIFLTLPHLIFFYLHFIIIIIIVIIISIIFIIIIVIIIVSIIMYSAESRYCFLP